MTEKFNASIGNEKFKLLMNYLNDIILFIGISGNIISANRAAVRAFGYSQNEFSEMSIFDLYDKKDRPVLEKFLSEILYSRRKRFKATQIRKDGCRFYVEACWHCLGTSCFCNSGKYEQLIMCVLQDITEKRELKRTLKQTFRSLQNTRKKLDEIQGQYEQQQECVNTKLLLACIFHEINNVIAGVSSNLAVLVEYGRNMARAFNKMQQLIIKVRNRIPAKLEEALTDIKDDSVLEYTNLIIADMEPLLDEIQEGLSYIREITADISLFSATSTSGANNANNVHRCNMNEIIQKVAGQIKPKILTYGSIEIIPGEIPSIPIKKFRLYQVIFNIVLNAAYAIKGRSDGKGVITISTYKNDNYLCCDIKDNGVGISKKNLKKVFNPYFTTRASREGTGLGLFLAHRIVTGEFGGELRVKSTPDKGSVFTIKLPINALKE